jgi:hypothetical protein
MMRALGNGAMAINRLLKDSKLEPNVVEGLNRAFEQALRQLHLVDRNDPLTELVARKIIEIGAAGVSDPAEIAKRAVEELRIA